MTDTLFLKAFFHIYLFSVRKVLHRIFLIRDHIFLSSCTFKTVRASFDLWQCRSWAFSKPFPQMCEVFYLLLYCYISCIWLNISSDFLKKSQIITFLFEHNFGALALALHLHHQRTVQDYYSSCYSQSSSTHFLALLSQQYFSFIRMMPICLQTPISKLTLFSCHSSTILLVPKVSCYRVETLQALLSSGAILLQIHFTWRFMDEKFLKAFTLFESDLLCSPLWYWSNLLEQKQFVLVLHCIYFLRFILPASCKWLDLWCHWY